MQLQVPPQQQKTYLACQDSGTGREEMCHDYSFVPTFGFTTEVENEMHKMWEAWQCVLDPKHCFGCDEENENSGVSDLRKNDVVWPSPSPVPFRCLRFATTTHTTHTTHKHKRSISFGFSPSFARQQQLPKDASVRK